MKKLHLIYIGIILLLLLGLNSCNWVSPNIRDIPIYKYRVKENNMASWRLWVSSPTGSYKGIISLSDPVSEINEMIVGGDGDCKEASLTLLKSGVNINARDIIDIEVNLGIGGGWVKIFAGYVTQSGSNRKTAPSTIKLVGMSQRLREVIIQTEKVSGGDIGNSMVRSTMANYNNRPPGVFYSYSNFPYIGVSLGNRYPRRQTAWQFMEEMASFWPGITWGVDANRELFFRQPVGTHTLYEALDGIVVDWHEPDVEEVVSAVEVLLFDTPQDPKIFVSGGGFGSLDPNFKPIVWLPTTYQYSDAQHGQYRAMKQVVWPKNTPLFANSRPPNVEDSDYQNPDNMYDGSGDTYASNLDSVPIVNGYQEDVPEYLAYRLVYEFGPEPDDGEAEFYLQLTSKNNSDTQIIRGYTKLLERDNTKHTEIIIVPKPYEATPGYSVYHHYVAVTGRNISVGSLKIYEFVKLTLDTVAIQSYAKSFIKLPKEEAGTATAYQQIISPLPKTRIFLADGGYVDNDAAAYEYSVTKAEGLKTIIRLEQAHPPEINAIKEAKKRIRTQEKMATIQSTGISPGSTDYAN